MQNDFIWQGRQDPEDGDKAKRWHNCVTKNKDADDILGALIGFACDEGVRRNKGRIGAAAGPDAIRNGLANMAWHAGNGHVLDLGNLSPEKNDLEQAQLDFADQVQQALDQYSKTIVLGGGHETAFASFSGLFSHLQNGPTPNIAILNLDAHFDLRKPGVDGPSSGTPFYQIHQLLENAGASFHYLCLGVAETSNTQALFDRANDWHVDYLLDRDMQRENMAQITSKIDAFLNKCDILYLTIDLDVLPFWQMPGVSAPATLGVELSVIEKIISHLENHPIHWPLSDLVEYNPALDPFRPGGRVAARLVDHIFQSMISKTAPVA